MITASAPAPTAGVPPGPRDSPVLEVRDLRVQFDLPGGRRVHAVDGVSFSLAPGKTLGIVGESGSGKTTVVRAILRIVETPGRIAGGRILYRDRDLLTFSEPEMRLFRSRKIAMIFQNPAGSLDPLFTIGDQFVETVRAHTDLNRRQAVARAREALAMVGVADPSAVMPSYPSFFNAGMIQRIMIGMAISCEPDVILADEPTTTLGVLAQAQILNALVGIQQRLGTAILLITHDMGVVAHVADDILVMYAGRCVEYGSKQQVLLRPLHPYTLGLMRSVPAIDQERTARLSAIPGFPPTSPLSDPAAHSPPAATDAGRCTTLSGRTWSNWNRVTSWRATRRYRRRNGSPSPMAEPLLRVEELRVAFPTRGGSLLGRTKPFVAVDGVSFAAARGEAFGIVGESGAGKTVLLRSLIRLIEPTGGTVVFDGRDVTRLRGRQLKEYRRRVHVIFQNPYNAFHPRMTIGESLREPLRIHAIGTPADAGPRIAEALRLVGMDPDFVSRYPRQFSGGQLQRLGLARALVLGADLLLADEPVSALDVSIQAQVLNLFQDLKEQLGLTYVVIAHDLAAVRYLCDRVAVMLRGRFVEMGQTDDLYAHPAHPYTQALLSAIPTIRRGVEGAAMAEVDPAAIARERARLTEIAPGHLVEVVV